MGDATGETEPDAEPNRAWLALPNSERHELVSLCRLGRSPENEVVLSDDEVSRQHALIHPQKKHRWYLVDLGSSNGTEVNDRRIYRPTRLADGDAIQCGDSEVVFHTTGSGRTGETVSQHLGSTKLRAKKRDCWVMVTDIVGSTRLAREHSPDELPLLTGGWFKRCRDIVEKSGGEVSQYLGDGMLAFWEAKLEGPDQIVTAVESLIELQKDGPLEFRFALHFGEVAVGSVPVSRGETNLIGSEVNFVFRIEKIAASWKAPVILSKPAADSLRSLRHPRSLGRSSVEGFEGQFEFFTW